MLRLGSPRLWRLWLIWFLVRTILVCAWLPSHCLRVAFPRCMHVLRALSPAFLIRPTVLQDQASTSTTSLNLNHLLKSLSPNTVTSWVGQGFNLGILDKHKSIAHFKLETDLSFQIESLVYNARIYKFNLNDLTILPL